MAVAIGMICEKDGFQYTVVVRDGVSPHVEEIEVKVPRSKSDRGDQLAYLLDEVEGLFRRRRPDIVYVKHAPAGKFRADPQRYEVEGIIQAAAHRVGVACALKTTEQIRKENGLPKSSGAFRSLLKRPDVAARSNEERRERYLYATTALIGVDDGS